MENFQVPCEFESCQVVSFPALKDERFESFYIDYGNSRETTCIWINHGPYELPQLLVLHVNFLEVEFRVTKFF